MIKIIQTRDRGSEHFDQGDYEIVSRLAVEKLLRFEMAYGGQITEVTDTSLTVVTCIFACKDTTKFVGPAEEMAPVIRAGLLYTELAGYQREKDIDALIQRTSGLPLLVTDHWSSE